MTLSYYGKQSVKVKIMRVLKENGWKIYGYKADESDPMTDYFSPSDWNGICEKNGYVLLVDIKKWDLSYSGKQVTKKGYTVDYAKIQKLQATIDDKAATQAEKETAQKAIGRMKQKEVESTIVVQEYPTFKSANPGKCSWHIEKDGEIIAKGTGVYSVHVSNNNEATFENINKLVSRFEKAISDNSQLEAVQVKQVNKVTKAVKTDRKELKKGDLVEFNGYYYQYTEDNYNNTAYVFIRLGKKFNLLKATDNNTKIYTKESIDRNLTSGYRSIFELQEVEEVTYKTVYKKVSRKQKAQEENLLQGETVSESPATEKAPTNTENNEVTYTLNEEKNGVEIRFSAIPSEEIRTEMKSNGFRWSKYSKCWYAKQSKETISLAKKLVGETAAEVEEVVTEVTQEQQEAKETSYNESIIDQFVDTATSFLDRLNAQLYNRMSNGQKNEYLQLLGQYIQNNNLDIDVLISHISDYNLLVEALTDIKNNVVFDVETVQEPEIVAEQKENEAPEVEKVNGKIQMSHIRLKHLDENENITASLYTTSYKDANNFIKEVANNSTSTYEIIQFTITFADNMTYKGELNALLKNNLTEHVKDFCYSVLSHRLSNHDELTDTVKYYQTILNHYQLEDTGNTPAEAETVYNTIPAEQVEAEKAFDLQFFSTQTAGTNLDDILNAFEDIDISSGNNSVITADDRKHCEELERQYIQVVNIYESTLSQLKHEKENNGYIGNYDDFNPIQDRIKKAGESFIHDVVRHFKETYSIEVDSWKLVKKYKDQSITLDILIDEIVIILDGLTFTELEAQQTKENTKNQVEHKKTNVKNDKISINSFFYVSFENYGTPRFKLGYGQHEKVTALFKAIAHYNNVEYKQFDELERAIKHKDNEEVFTVHELELNKIKSIKLYKNGRLDIQFASSHDARTFYNEYLQ